MMDWILYWIMYWGLWIGLLAAFAFFSFPFTSFNFLSFPNYFVTIWVYQYINTSAKPKSLFTQVLFNRDSMGFPLIKGGDWALRIHLLHKSVQECRHSWPLLWLVPCSPKPNSWPNVDLKCFFLGTENRTEKCRVIWLKAYLKTTRRMKIRVPNMTNSGKGFWYLLS